MDTINALPSSASPLYFSEYHGVVWQDTHTHTHTHTQGQCWSSPAPLLTLLLFSLPIPERSWQYDKSTLLCIFHRSDTEHESGKTSETIIAADSLNWASSSLLDVCAGVPGYVTQHEYQWVRTTINFQVADTHCFRYNEYEQCQFLTMRGGSNWILQ